MKRIFFSLWLVICIGSLQAVLEQPADDQDLSRFSYYTGYMLWQDHSNRAGVDYAFEQVLAGMQAANDGVPLELGNDQELSAVVRKMQRVFVAKQNERHLAHANAYMAERIAEKDTLQLVPDKLCYKRLEEGKGEQVDIDGAPVLVMSWQFLELNGCKDFFSEDKPTAVTLKTTIPGFSKGVAGMRVGERRRLYIHPELGYGEEGGVVGPNRLLICDVEVVAIRDKSSS